MKTRHLFATALIAGSVLAPLNASAQQTQQQPPSEVQEWVAEMQQIQTQLEPIQLEALQDTAVQRHQSEVGEVVRAAIVAIDPTLDEGLDRMEELMVQAQAAQAASDAEKIAELTAEAQTLQPRIEQAQQQALADPEVQTEINAFQEHLQERMVEIDPETRTMLARLQELDSRVRAVIGGV